MAKAMLIYCGGRPFQYTLARDGEKWKVVFNSFEETVEEARKIVTEETPLLVYDASGHLLLKTTVPPAGGAGTNQKV